MIKLKTLYVEYQAEWNEVLEKATKIAQEKGLRVPENIERDAEYALKLIGVEKSYSEVIEDMEGTMLIRWLE